MLCCIHFTAHWASCCRQGLCRMMGQHGRLLNSPETSAPSHGPTCCDWHSNCKSVLQVFDGHNGRTAGELASNYMLSNLQRCLVSSQAASVEDALVRLNIGHMDIAPCVGWTVVADMKLCWVIFASLAGCASYTSGSLLPLQTFSAASSAMIMHSMFTQPAPAAGPELRCHRAAAVPAIQHDVRP